MMACCGVDALKQIGGTGSSLLEGNAFTAETKFALKEVWSRTLQRRLSWLEAKILENDAGSDETKKIGTVTFSVPRALSIGKT